MFTFTVYDLLEKNLVSNPDKIAVELGDESLTYGQLGQAVDALAAWLETQGVQRRDRIAIHLRKSIEEIVATFAIARIGAVYVNVNYQWTLHQLDYIVDDCQAKLVITDGRKAKGLVESETVDKLMAVLVHGKTPDHDKAFSWNDVPDASPSSKKPIDIELAALLYTSGSTGMPKGVMLTHANIIHGARSVASYLKNTADDRVLGLLPMSFDYGMSQVTTMFLVGGSIVLQPVVIPAEIIKTMVSKKVTGLAAVPPAWIQVVRYLQEASTALPDLRYITNSGGKIPQPILDAMPDVFPGVDIYLMYGLTEAFRSSYLPPELYETKKGSIGRAIPNSELYVVHPEKGLCGPGEHGELIHRGGLISQGYWNKPELTDEKIKVCPALVPLIGEEKVLYSGDIVYRDEDGILWFVNRADGMIKCSGYRISPTEVEEIIYAMPKTADVVAFGVDDDELGQVVHVAISTPSGDMIDAESVRKHCQNNMPTYMVPAVIHTWEGQMPRTASGKLDRPAVIKSCKG